MTLNEALSNEEIAKEFEEANSMEDILATLKKYGVETTEEELMNTISEESGELSDDQLESVAGGLIINPLMGPLITSNIIKLGTKALLNLLKSGKLKPFYLPNAIRKMLKL